MADLKSKILLCKGIKLDKNYNNVLSYSESNMLSLCSSSSHLVASDDDYSFIRTNGNIFTNFTYSQCLQANYIAFQNKDYNNKWFFAFIDDVIYKGDGNTEIKYTIDSWSTWFDYWTKKACYIIRQHVNSDNIGEHTVPENLDTGKYIIDEMIKVNELTDMAYIIQVTQWTSGSNPPLATNYGGVWSVGGAYVTDNIEVAINILTSYGENVKNIVYGFYMCPKAIINHDFEGNTTQYSGQSQPLYIDKYINKPTTLNGYTPKNKKLLTAPYCFLNLSNNNGRINTYYYELFNEVDEYPNKCIFNIAGVPTVGGSIKCSPNNYKMTNENDNEDEGIIAGKYPTLSWSDNAYINWLTQNSVNISSGVVTSALLTAGGIIGANPTAIVTGGASLISNLMSSNVKEEMAPNSAVGNTNGGDITTSDGTNTFYFYRMSIRREYAKKIDDFLTRYGYKIMEVTTPNIIGRTNWNYIEIGSNESIGYGTVPSKYMEEINSACRKGITIWHSHDNLGNFALNNSIS